MDTKPKEKEPMAQRTVVTYYSDLSGAEIGAEDVGVRFGLDGDDFEIDLSADEYNALHQALAPFLAVARKAGSGKVQQRSAVSGNSITGEPDSRTLRSWGLENGFDLPPRGRVPELVREAYKAAGARQDVGTPTPS
jgi:hypothetical protein